MRTIMLMNPSEGCGKTTLATNIATWFADEGNKVALADFDPKGAALGWLAARQNHMDVPGIKGINAAEDGVYVSKGTEYLILDAPAGVHSKEIDNILRQVQTLIIPVLPSSVETQACSRFIHELLVACQVSRQCTCIAVVANRVEERTLIYQQLEKFLDSLGIPFLTSLYESPCYMRSAEQGLGIFEMDSSNAYPDLVQWDPVFDWLNSDASLPLLLRQKR